MPASDRGDESIEAGQECAIMLGGDGTELVSQETADDRVVSL